MLLPVAGCYSYKVLGLSMVMITLWEPIVDSYTLHFFKNVVTGWWRESDRPATGACCWPNMSVLPLDRWLMAIEISKENQRRWGLEDNRSRKQLQYFESIVGENVIRYPGRMCCPWMRLENCLDVPYGSLFTRYCSIYLGNCHIKYR
jgi:hypothetical protein